MAMAEWLDWIKQAEQLFDQKRYEEAETLAARALAVMPNSPQVHQVLGLVHSERGRPQDAIQVLARALSLQTDLVPSHNGIGRCYFLTGELDKALAHFETALRLQADHAFAHFNRAMVLLKKGQYHEGWLDYEWRWQCGLIARPKIPRPRWDGSPLAGRSLMIHTEQGIGDVFQFVRFMPQLKSQGARIVFACQKALHKVLRNLPFVDEWFPIDEPGNVTFEMYCPLLSLPGIFDVREETIPRTVPYIPVDRERALRWRPRIESLPGFKVGLGWQGSPTFKGDQYRSIPLEQYAPLAQVPGVTLVSLQKGAGVEQLEPNRERVPVHAFADLDEEGAFLDTVAMSEHLDLIITSDSALAHVAGALGRPVWVLLGVNSDWRWLLERTDSPWYPSMRLFRQKTFGDWAGVFEEVAAALRTLIGRGKAKPPARESLLTAPVSAGELIDKLTILQIKLERISDEAKLANVRRELDLLGAARRDMVPDSPELDTLTTDLKKVNEQLWEIEDDIRLCEKAGQFDQRFIELARSVYVMNDRRSALKRQINELSGSAIVEEKSYK